MVNGRLYDAATLNETGGDEEASEVLVGVNLLLYPLSRRFDESA